MELMVAGWLLAGLVSVAVDWLLRHVTIGEPPRIEDNEQDEWDAKWDELFAASQEHLMKPDDRAVRHRLERAIEALE